MNADGGERKQLTNTPVAEFLSDWSSDGKTLAFTRNSDPRYSEGYLLSLENGSEQKLDLPSEARNSLGNFSPDGTKITFETDTKGNSDIGIFDLKSNTSTWLANDPTEDESVGDWSPDGQTIVYVENNEGNFEIKLKPANGGEAKTIALKKGINGAPRWFPDGKKLALTYSGSTQPTNIWTTTLDGTETKQLTFSAPPNVDPSVLVDSALVHYPTFDGKQISAWLYRPKNVKPGEKAPAILLIHGGPSAQSLNGWSTQIQFFVNNGYLVLAPNVRGSTGYGKTFEELNDKDWGGGDLKDVIAAREYLIKEGLADEQHIGITGGSYGGYMTFMALTQYPDLWAAGVSVVGVVNLETLWKTTTGSLRYYLLSELGKPEENQQLYHDRSPLNFVDRIKAPLLILVGERDPRVPLSEFEQIKQKLEASKIPFESKVYAGEGHGFRKEENRLDSLQRTIEFFDKYLKTEHAPAATTEQEQKTYSVAQYLDIQSSGSGRLSPDGTALLYTNNATGTSQVYKLDLKTNQVTQLTNYEDGVGLVGWAPDGSGFIFGKGSGGNERTQLYSMSKI
ncbi:alpha/beta fold hydrolase [Candidatus Acetothermia bacterium]|nr:alpha/beta fold hydrolase [Candidatus Acetothermia bacterium]